MRIGFMGTSEFAVRALEELLNSEHEVVYIVTQPDRPKGRGKKLQFPPVKEAAVKAGREVLQPLKIKDLEAVQEILEIPVDVIVVAAYGQIIPEAILNHPAYGCINIHGSLLPEYRGAAPIQRAIMEGKEKTGVTIMHMAKGLDTGDMILKTEVAIGEDEDYGSLADRLAEVGAGTLMEVLRQFQAGTAKRTVQDDALSNYAARLESSEELIDWNRDVLTIHNQIRSLAPKPGAYTWYEGKRFKILASHVLKKDGTGLPGVILGKTDAGFAVQTGTGVLEVRAIQKEGKNRMNAVDFVRGAGKIEGKVFAKE